MDEGEVKEEVRIEIHEVEKLINKRKKEVNKTIKKLINLFRTSFNF